MLRQIIADIFDDKLKDTFKDKPNILKFLLEHERKNLCLDNLMKEIKIAEEIVNISKSHLKMLVNDFAIIFAKSAIQHKEQQLLSDAEKARQVKQHEEQEEYKEMLESDDMVKVQEYSEDTK